MAIDYAKAANWLSLPSQLDPVKNVDVFYVYPTAYSAGTGGALISEINNAQMMAGAKYAFQKNATAFATVGNIYAPYYRQADAVYTLGLPSTDAVYDFIGGTPATDVIAAFDYYIKNYNNNRPFILVSHSQGSTIVALLLQNYMKANPDVYQRMIAAYAIGWSFTQDYFDRNPHLKFAQGPDDTGVIISYNTQSPSFTGRNPVVFPGAMAINPISWTRTATLAPASANAGSLRLFDATAPAPFYQGDVIFPVQTVTGYADAQIAAINPTTSALDPNSATEVVLCSTVDPATIKRPSPIAPGFFHSYDYPFYYSNIAANAANRVARYLNQ
ncbi:DUF3089 domain-containing protein [Geomesophilobacter sediminis]|uniref:DUF3089 domain-containing protein n=1 Tax=Geomesophilobacter sediminis TaxID=2798584 RepID=A0A8J7LXK2_9BACT|nr:DUF3089 domain-containing protein [Geomesophilobacter sediminis]MBJ6723241.1 DUF3089 domain-containing protein [Geomesophilobacter sediminis]